MHFSLTFTAIYGYVTQRAGFWVERSAHQLSADETIRKPGNPSNQNLNFFECLKHCRIMIASQKQMMNLVC